MSFFANLFEVLMLRVNCRRVIQDVDIIVDAADLTVLTLSADVMNAEIAMTPTVG